MTLIAGRYSTKSRSKTNWFGLSKLCYDRIDYFYPNEVHTSKMKTSYNLSLDLFGIQMVTPESKLTVPLNWCTVNR